MPGSGEGLVENHGCLEWKFYGGMLERDRELGLKSKTYRFLYLTNYMILDNYVTFYCLDLNFLIYEIGIVLVS